MQFNKEMPGAELRFQPDDLPEYADDAWDIRISLGDAPLEEAFYFTVDDPRATLRSISELLEEYALNPDRRGELKIADDPDLPFMQEELIQYYRQSRELDVQFYVNQCPHPGAVSLATPAQGYLSTCTYHDGSLDYRLLDLVLVAGYREAEEHDLALARKQYGSLFLLMLIGEMEAKGSLSKFTGHEAVGAFLGAPTYNTEYFQITEDLKKLESQFLIEKQGKKKLKLSEAGRESLNALDEENKRLAERYDRFDSVGIAPPALGVPGGFDARVQMMEYDGIDREKSVLLRVIDLSRKEVLNPATWYEQYASFDFFNDVRDALAYQTNFSGEVMKELQALAGR